MLASVMLGATYGLGAAIQPGPLQAYLVSETMISGWRRAAPAALAPLVSDIPIVALVLLALAQVPAPFIRMLQITGGAFLLYLAFGAARNARHYRELLARPPASHVTFLKAVLLNLLNPNPYLGWALVLGPLTLSTWRRTPGGAVALVAAFYAALVSGTAGIVFLLAAARALGPRVGRFLVGASAVGLAAFALYSIWLGLG